MIAILLIIAGLILRGYNLTELSGFDFDAETASFWIKNLLVDHKFSLIGQEISLGGIFIGPFYYYFLTPFYFILSLDPIAGNIAVTLFSIPTMLFIYLAAKQLFSKQIGLIALILYAFSSQINVYDRTTAPSNLIMLLSLATLYFMLKRKFLILGILFGLSFSVHPTAVMLLPISLIFLRPSVKNVMLTVLPTAIFALPLFIFDLRHDFLMSHRLVEIFSTSSISNSSYPFIFKFLINLRTLTSTFFQTLLPFKPNLYFLIFLPFFIWSLTSTNKKLFLTWTAVPLLLLSFYPSHVPEYYFLVILPILIIFFAAFLTSIVPKLGIIFILLVFCLLNISTIFKAVNLGSLHYKKQAVNQIITASQDKPFQVSYQTWPGLNHGYNYLFFWRKREPSLKANQRYIIVSPSSLSNESGVEFGMIKIVNKDD